METKSTPTYEEMKAEAVLRMKSIGLAPELIEKYSNNEVQTFESPDGTAELIYNFEENFIIMYEDAHHGAGWGMIKEPGEGEFCEELVEYCLFFVSPDPGNWEKERAELLSMNPEMYCYEYYPERSAGGIVQLGFERRKIRMTPGGTPVLA